jgi:hypothetical protein
MPRLEKRHLKNEEIVYNGTKDQNKNTATSEFGYLMVGFEAGTSKSIRSVIEIS